MRFTVIIPAYNEEEGLGDVVRKLEAFLHERRLEGSILVVNDGSTDGTAACVQSIPNVRVINHPYNKGYGAALKTGIRAAETELCLTYDADGQHTPDLILKLLDLMSEGIDMVIGKREGWKGPRIRQPGKWLIARVANYLVERDIPDLNSGLRIFRRDTFLRYAHLFPNGFSISTTSTVCYYKENLNILFTPITIQPRTGTSTVRPRDALKMLMFIMRLIMTFSPLRIFLPASVVLGTTAVALLVYQILMENNISDAAVILIALTAITFFFGLLADQISAMRREGLRQQA